MIDEHYEQMRATRRKIERVAVRLIALVVVFTVVAAIIACLQTGIETFEGPRLVESNNAGSDSDIVLAALTLLPCITIWVWPRPRTVVLSGLMLWALAITTMLLSYRAPRYHDAPTGYTYVFHETASHLADHLLSGLTLAWFALPIAALVYGTICAIADDHQARKLPPGPEFPVAKLNRG